MTSGKIRPYIAPSQRQDILGPINSLTRDVFLLFLQEGANDKAPAANNWQHFFISCQRSKSLWQNFICFTEPVFRKQNWTIAQILFGMLRSDKKSLALNWLDLIMKYYKWKNTALSFKAFEENVKYEQKLEKEG